MGAATMNLPGCVSTSSERRWLAVLPGGLNAAYATVHVVDDGDEYLMAENRYAESLRSAEALSTNALGSDQPPWLGDTGKYQDGLDGGWLFLALHSLLTAKTLRNTGERPTNQREGDAVTDFWSLTTSCNVSPRLSSTSRWSADRYSVPLCYLQSLTYSIQDSLQTQ